MECMAYKLQNPWPDLSTENSVCSPTHCILCRESTCSRKCPQDAPPLVVQFYGMLSFYLKSSMEGDGYPLMVPATEIVRDGGI